MRAALFGNPNTGKTSLFNVLCGSYEFVGNWSGVTVEKKVGRLKDHAGSLIDLPGIYSMSPVSKDESVVASFLLDESFTVALNIIDASQLMRNLNLTIDLLEFGHPVIIALNMMDVARHRGIHVDPQRLAEKLSVPVVPIVARTGRGCHVIQDMLTGGVKNHHNGFRIDYGLNTEEAISDISSAIDLPADSRRWFAVQFLDGNQAVEAYARRFPQYEKIRSIREKLQTTVQTEHGTTVSGWMRSQRNKFIKTILPEVVQKQETRSHTATDRIDAVVTNKFLGIPIFLGIMYFIFHATFNWIGNPVSDILDGFFAGPLTQWTHDLLLNLGVVPLIRDVILNGIISGIGGVLVFVPQIIVLFFFISWIEDSGYMARVALVMDRVMQMVGLNGKAFIPLVIGFGCNIPGIMAARTIEQPKERLLTVLITPLMSCSARLTVYSLFAGVFFARYQALVVLSLYAMSIVIALLMAKLFSLFMKTPQSVFVVDLPPYRVPNLRTLVRSTWDKAKGFIKKATTFILGGTVLVWLLSYLGPDGMHVPIEQSFLAIICTAIAPIVAPLGFGSWQAASALITGFLAKESVVSTLGIVYHTAGGISLSESIKQAFTPLEAYSFMVFTLLYVPCLSTVPAIRQETGTGRMTWFAVGYCIVLAYLVTFIVYRTGLLLGFD